MSEAGGGAVRAASSAGDLILLPMAKLAADVATTTARAIPSVLARNLPNGLGGAVGPLTTASPRSPALTSTLTVASSLSAFEPVPSGGLVASGEACLTGAERRLNASRQTAGLTSSSEGALLARRDRPNFRYREGSTNRFSIVDVTRPPRMTTAMGCSISWPGIV